MDLQGLPLLRNQIFLLEAIKKNNNNKIKKYRRKVKSIG